MQCGDIVLMYSRKFLSRAIIWALNFFQQDDAYYSHVAIAVNDKEVTEALSHGIRKRSFEESASGAKRYKIVRYKYLTDKQMFEIQERLLEKVNTNYNYWQIFLQLLDNMFNTNWFTRKLNFWKGELNICSSYVAWAYYKATGLKFNDVHWSSVEPDDIDDETEKNENDWEIIECYEKY